MARDPYDVCAAVVGDLAIDARVWKEVNSLAGAGYRIRLIAGGYGFEGIRRTRKGLIDVVEVSLGSRSGAVNWWRRAQALGRIWREVLRTEAHAYHVHNIHAGPAAVLAARVRGAPLIYDAHELYGGTPPGPTAKQRVVARFNRAVEGRICHAADRVITTNERRASVLRKRHHIPPPTVLHNVPYRVDPLEPINPGFPNGRPVLLYQGGIYARQRAFRETLAALRELPDVHFAVLGFGRESEIEYLRATAREYGVQDRLQLLPPRPFEQLVATAVHATVGIVPLYATTINQILGDTNKLFEYLMAGVPVVASELPVVADVVNSGSPPVGEVFDPRSPESIAAAIRRVIGDPDQYAARRGEARRLALEQYCWEREEPLLLRIYDWAVGSQNSGGRGTLAATTPR